VGVRFAAGAAVLLVAGPRCGALADRGGRGGGAADGAAHGAGDAAMSLRVRLTVFGLGALGLAVLYALAVAGMPDFGGAFHPYRDIAVTASVNRVAPNAVSSVNFDQRAL